MTSRGHGRVDDLLRTMEDGTTMSDTGGLAIRSTADISIRRRRGWHVGRLLSTCAVLLLLALTTGGGSGALPAREASTYAGEVVTAPHLPPPPRAAPGRLSGTRSWHLTRPALAGQIEGYAVVDTSLPPAHDVPLRVSTTAARYRVQAYRFGWYAGGDAHLVWTSSWLPGRRQAGPVFQPARMRTVVAPWRDSLVLPSADWVPGAYLLKLTASSGWQSYVPLIVRSPSARGRVALVAPVVTWQAYNDWGGYSLYAGANGDRPAWQVSFDRPYAGAGPADLLYGVRAVVVRAERLGIPLAYLTDVDLDADPEALAGARAFVDLGHDEYWTPTMRRRVLAARSAGTNLAFLGANTMYWRVRLTPTATGPRRAVVGYRHYAALDPLAQPDSPRTTAAFRDAPAADPENSLTGLRYECYPVDATYRVVDPGWWGFAGTGVTVGTAFEHLVGVEADRVYPVAGTPRPLEVLAHSPYSCGGQPTSAQSVYYTDRSGAGVFNAGTLRWTCAPDRRCGRVTVSERTARFTRKVLDNVLLAFAAGPAGRAHPARDNVDLFPLPRSNNVPAS